MVVAMAGLSDPFLELSCGLRVEPGKELFLVRLAHSIFEASGFIQLENCSGERVEYRVKSKLRECLLACGSTGILHPGEIRSVSILLKKGVTVDPDRLVIHLKARPINSQIEETAIIECKLEVKSESVNVSDLPSLPEEPKESEPSSSTRKATSIQFQSQQTENIHLLLHQADSCQSNCNHSNGEKNHASTQSDSKTIQMRLRQESFPSIIASKDETNAGQGDNSLVVSKLKVLEEAGMSPKNLIREQIANCLFRMGELVLRSPALDILNWEEIQLHGIPSEGDTLEAQVVHQVGDYVQKLINDLEAKNM